MPSILTAKHEWLWENTADFDNILLNLEVKWIFLWKCWWWWPQWWGWRDGWQVPEIKCKKRAQMWLSFFPGGEVPVSSVRCSVFEKQRPDWSGAYYCGKVPIMHCNSVPQFRSRALKATKTKHITMYMLHSSGSKRGQTVWWWLAPCVHWSRFWIWGKLAPKFLWVADLSFPHAAGASRPN